jgi:predicted outer membrane repeat protein
MKILHPILLALLASMLTCYESPAQKVIHVPGDQPTIQEGIDAASNGDTVLVDPGVYVELINYNGKSITLASLYLVTSDTSYISQTEIEGNEYWEMALVRAHSGEDSTTLLCGFTIRNNSGGGISCSNSFLNLDHVNVFNNMNLGYPIYRFPGGGIANTGSMHLKDVNIRGNYSIQWGGGIYNAGEMYLEGVNITNNSARAHGGGICSETCLQFDSVNRCNIHSNFAWSGKDLSFSEEVTVFLDTFSVLYPTNYFASPLDNFTFDILHGKIAQVSADLYVSPQGDNSGSGLSVDDPFKTITHAVSVILSDSLSPHHVFLSEGTYSNSTNGERFALNLPFYTSLTGIGPDQVILDAEQECIPLLYLGSCVGSVISGLTVRNSSCGGIEIIGSDIELNNIVISDNTNDDSWTEAGGMACLASKVLCNNVIIQNNVNIDPIVFATGGGIDCRGSILSMNNCSLLENQSQWGGAMNAYQSDIELRNVVISGNWAIKYGGISIDFSTLETRNVLFTGNEFSAYCGHVSNSRMINTTFSGNNLNSSSWQSIILDSDTLNLHNCIL